MINTTVVAYKDFRCRWAELNEVFLAVDEAVFG